MIRKLRLGAATGLSGQYEVPVWGRLRDSRLAGLASLVAVALGLAVAVGERAAVAPATGVADQTLALSGSSPAAAGVAERYARLPLAFTPNAGQSARGVRYMAQAAGVGFYFLRDRVVLDLRRPPQASTGLGEPASLERGSGPFAGAPGSVRGVALQLRFVGANPHPQVIARDRAAGTVSYLNGSTAARGLASYRELVYRELWPGIDMVLRGERGRLKYEFHVAPRADPAAIRLAYAGADGLSLAPGGALGIETALGTLRDTRPVSYQSAYGRRVAVRSRYALRDGAGYGFALGPYQPGQPLVIDPGLVYSSYLGSSSGDGSDELGWGIAVDGAGHAYVAGSTQSANFPTTAGAYDEGHNGGEDVFVTKFNTAGSDLVYSTVLGGGLDDSGQGIAVDSSGQAYVAGHTQSGDFPTTAGAYDESHNGGHDVFVAKVNAAGSDLVYSTLLGGGDLDDSTAIAVDASGQAYLTGGTNSAGFPTTAGAFDTGHNGDRDVFVAKLNPSGSGLAYSTLVGGVSFEEATGLAIDAAGQAYATGYSIGGFPTTPSAFDVTNGGEDAFVAKLDATGSALVYSSYLGGPSLDPDLALAIAVDPAGQAYVTGTTASADFPTTAGAYDETPNAPFAGFDDDAFVAKFNAAGSDLVYSTFLGGDSFDRGAGVAVDGAGQAYVTGDTWSTNFPTTVGAFDRSFNGVADVFETTLNAAGSDLAYSSLIGGDETDFGRGIALDGAGQLYLTGFTSSGGFPTTTGADDPTYSEEVNSGYRDAFVTKLDPTAASIDCADGIDNDGDGRTDFPADRDCDSPADASENRRCDDGVDNDGDGATDFPADPGCKSATDNDETNARCNDTLDNDGDSLADYPADPGCRSATDNDETNVRCNDTLDNDSDGTSDYPADPGCSSLADNNEANARCNDTLDNDSDGATDFPADPGCKSAKDNNESG